jgi:hypothetical protein
MGQKPTEIVELNTDLTGSPYYNPDMVPTTRAERR